MDKKFLYFFLILLVGMAVLFFGEEVKAQPELDYSFPTSASSGSTVTVNATCTNNTANFFNSVYLYIDMGGRICRQPSSGSRPLNPSGGNISCSGSFTMPAGDTTVNIYCYYDSGSVVEAHPVVTLPAAANGGGEEGGNGGVVHPPGAIVIENPIESETFEQLVDSMVNFLFYFGIVFAPLMLIIAGFLFVTAMGEPEKIKKARDCVIWALIGVAILVLARGIIAVVKTILGV